MFKKIFPTVGILIIFNSNVFGCGAFISCTPSVTSNTKELKLIINNEFLNIKNTIQSVNKSNKKYAIALNKLNIEYAKNRALKKEYLITLKNISFELNKIKRIESLK